MQNECGESGNEVNRTCDNAHGIQRTLHSPRDGSPWGSIYGGEIKGLITMT
jgi:hypothetical protein